MWGAKTIPGGFDSHAFLPYLIDFIFFSGYKIHLFRHPGYYKIMSFTTGGKEEFLWITV
jgi:hypothetical protein